MKFVAVLIPKPLRYCYNCAKRVPNFRQIRAQTCKVQCTNEFESLGLVERERRKKIATDKLK